MNREPPGLIANIDVGAVRQQEFGDWRIAFLCRQVQRIVSIVIDRINIYTQLNQHLYDALLTAINCGCQGPRRIAARASR